MVVTLNEDTPDVEISYAKPGRIAMDDRSANDGA